jgi:hypothetical protein
VAVRASRRLPARGAVGPERGDGRGRARFLSEIGCRFDDPESLARKKAARSAELLKQFSADSTQYGTAARVRALLASKSVTPEAAAAIVSAQDDLDHPLHEEAWEVLEIVKRAAAADVRAALDEPSPDGNGIADGGTAEPSRPCC